MSCIHYKFRSALEYDTITFDGLSISLADLKHSIITQKKFGKNTDFDLEVTNAQTKEEYKDEMTMIPKNSSVVVRRIPVGTKSKAQLAAERASPFSSGEQKTVADLANADASEEDKLKAMMKQSGEDWEPSQYVRGRRPYAPGVPVPQNYVCYRCGKPGHFIRNCPTNGDNRFDVPKAKRTTGIPRTFLGTAEGTASPPGRSSPSLPEADSKTKGKEKDTPNKKVPSELKCPTCNNLLTDAVLIPCCGTSYCDDCIRNYLLENEQMCPSCRSENVSPDSLVINKQLRQAVNTFKNARPASPYVTTLQKSTSVVSNDLQTTAKVANDRYPPESASSEKVVPDSKPAEHRVVKEVNETESKTKESSPKRTEPLKPPTSQPQPIRVHHREASAQQGVGLKQGGAPFDARRRQGEFLPRAQPRLPGVRHGLSEPIIPHGLPPEHIPRVPAVRPGISGPSHPGPRTNIPGYVPSIRTTVPAAIPRIPPVPTLVPGPLPHHPPFGARVFDPLRPADGSLTPPMSEREFYKMQKKLKSRTKKKREHEHPSSTHTSRESRPRKQLKKEPRKEPKKDGNVFDFDDELSEYRKLQKSRQRLRSRSLTPSRSWSHSPSRSRSRSFTRSRSPSRSPSRSSPSPARSPTPEGWDESRSPSPASSRDQGASVSAEDKKRKHKKRKKEQKSKERKKRKTSDGKDESVKEQKDAPVPDKNEEKTSDKKKHKRREKEKDSKATADDKDKGKDVGEEKDEKERKEKDKEERKTKEKLKKKGNDKEKEKKSKKKKGKEKKDESSSGKKRKSKKKHKKHKRHKKEKSKEGEDVKESGKAGEKFSTDEHETRESDEDETQHSDSDKKDKKSDEQESISEEENDNEKVNNVETEEKEQEGMTEQNKEGEKIDVQEVNEASERKGKKPPDLRSDEGGHRKLLGNISDEENDFLAGKEEKELKKQKFEIGNGSGSGLETRNGSEVKKHGQ